MDAYLNLAKLALESFVKKGRVISPPKNLPAKLFQKRAGVFVTIYKKCQEQKSENPKRKDIKPSLRGCVGTYLPTKNNLAEEIISSAVAASQDPRFLPVQEEELPCLKYEVSVLEPPRPIKKLEELNPQKYGILIKSVFSPRSGLLLPDLKGIKTREQQIFAVCQKSGIDPEKEKFIIYKFGVEKHE